MKSNILFYLFLLIVYSVQSQTIIPGGYVSGTWTSFQSPYHIQGNIEIHYDSTLVIEPGVDVLFDGSFKLTVHGLLDASGTVTDSILFTANDPVTGWQGIEFIQINEELGISNVKFCTLTHGKKPSGYGGAIYVYQAENVLISNCLIMDNYADEGGGIYMNDGWIIVENSIITHNSAYGGAGGIACIYSRPYFYNLQITYNTSRYAGGVLFAANPGYSWPFFEYLTITNNEGGTVGGLSLESSTTLVLNHCKITNNRGNFIGGIALFDSSFEIWSPYDKNQVYMNSGGLVQELYSDGGQSTVINIDTFTVINPDSYHVYPLDKFLFGDDGILYGLIEQVDTSLFISETGSDTNNGLTPGSPLRSFEYALRKIISDTLNNNTLWVMPGHYHIPETEPGTAIYLKDEVKIKATAPGEAILDGDSTSRVLFGYEKKNFTLSGLTIQNGRYQHYPSPQYIEIVNGGGLYLYSSKGTIDSCLFNSNYTTRYGGAVYLGGNNYVAFTNTGLSQNTAEYGGGGVDLDGYNNVSFNNCNFLQNTAIYGGGGLLTNYNSSGPLVINQCLFSENHSGEEGGGLTYSGSEIRIKNSQFIANTSVAGGAGCYCDVTAQMPGFINCLFSKNISEEEGGGIFFSGITVSKLINCTFSDNQAVSGSAVYQLYLYKLYCINTIFWNSEVPPADMIHVKSSGYPLTTGFYTNYSDIQGGESSIVVEDGGVHWEEGNITAYPAYNDPSNGDYSLNWNSPCIEAGKGDTTGLYLPLTDLNGDPRLVNPVIDMGAYEFQFPVNINPAQPVDSPFRIYPKTAGNRITIEFPQEFREDRLILKIFSSNGSEVKSSGKNSGSSVTEIDVSELSPGLYFLVIMDYRHVLNTCKIIIAR